MGTKQFSNYSDLLTFTRASKGHALRPVSYGTELVTNGTFDSDLSDWYAASNGSRGNITWTNETVVVDNSISNYNGAVQSITTEVGKIYKFEAEFVAFTGTSNNCALAVTNIATGTGAYASNSSLSIGVNQVIFVAQQTTTYIVVTAGTSTDATYDNISVKEVLFDQPDGTLTLFEHPNNVPRVEYDADGNRLGLLVEELRTNLVLYSEDFSTDWNNTNDHIDVNPYGGSTPDGQASGFEISERSRTGRHALRDTHSFTSGLSYTFSVFAKKSTSDWCQLFIGSGAFPTMHQNFNLATGQKGSGSGVDSSQIQDFGNGWYRISITATANATTGSDVFITLTDNSDSGRYPSYAGDGTSGIYIYGAQLEAGSFPTSYIKSNSGSTTTRSADVASIPVADFGYNTAVGSVVAEYYPTKVESQIRSVFELAKDGNERLYSASASNRHWFVKSGGTEQANIDLGSSTEDQSNKIAGAYKKDDFAASLDGGSVTTDTSGSVQTGTTALHIGGIKSSADNYLNGHIKSIQYYPRRLTNAQLEALTEPRSTPTLSLTFDGLESSYTENYIHG